MRARSAAAVLAAASVFLFATACTHLPVSRGPAPEEIGKTQYPSVARVYEKSTGKNLEDIPDPKTLLALLRQR